MRKEKSLFEKLENTGFEERAKNYKDCDSIEDLIKVIKLEVAEMFPEVVVNFSHNEKSVACYIVSSPYSSSLSLCPLTCGLHSGDTYYKDIRRGTGFILKKIVDYIYSFAGAFKFMGIECLTDFKTRISEKYIKDEITAELKQDIFDYYNEFEAKDRLVFEKRQKKQPYI